jgi:hypothetical protein
MNELLSKIQEMERKLEQQKRTEDLKIRIQRCKEEYKKGMAQKVEHGGTRINDGLCYLLNISSWDKESYFRCLGIAKKQLDYSMHSGDMHAGLMGCVIYHNLGLSKRKSVQRRICNSIVTSLNTAQTIYNTLEDRLEMKKYLM